MTNIKHYILIVFILCTVNIFASKEYGYDCRSYKIINNNQVIFSTDTDAKLMLQLSSPSVVKIWYSPTGHFVRNNESFAVVNEDLEPISVINVDDQSSSFEIYTSKLRIRLNKNPMQLQIFDKYQKLMFSDYMDKGHVSDSLKKVAYKVLRPDEKIYGLGEKSGVLDRNGRNYKMWNSDRPCYGAMDDPLYKSVPFFMSSYRYGIFLDNTYKTEFKFGTESQDYYSFEAPDGEFVYYFIFGKDYKEIQQQYISLTGKPIMPPKWALGFSQCRGLYTKEDQAREIASEFRKREIPCDIIYQDIGWTNDLMNFEWRAGNYTNPQGMLKDLEAKGFKVIVSQDPVVSQRTQKQWEEADQNNYFVKDVRTGKSYDMPWPWGGNCGIVDFTKPEVADWWGKLQQQPIDAGVKGFWTDMGEPAWSNEEDHDRLFIQHHIGMHNEIHNVYGHTWDMVVKEQFEKRNPNKRLFQMTRSAYAGLQRFTFGWTGDSGNSSDAADSWSQLANQVAVGISTGLGGVPFWTTDISGYCGDITDYPATAELYTRWMQFGVFNPLSRAHHEGDNAVEPWMFGEVAEKNCKAAIEMKYQLFPYLYTYSRVAHDTGLPIVRGLFMEYPDDEEACKVNDQFMFGQEIMVAPVVKKGERVKRIYLPEGEWIDYNNPSKTFIGGQYIAYPCLLSTIPMFVKKGSVIPQMPIMQYIHENKDFPLYLHIYPHYQDEKASFELYEDDGESLDYQKDIFSTTKVECLTLANGYTVDVQFYEQGFVQSDNRNVVLKLHLDKKPLQVEVDKKKVKNIDQAKMSKAIDAESKSVLWMWNEQRKECWVKLPATKKNSKVFIN